MVVRDWLSSTLNNFMNSKQVGKKEVVVMPVSKLILGIFEIMKKNNYIVNFKIEEDKLKKAIVELGKINKCKAINPRFYVKKDEFEKYIKRYLPARDFGILIVSTNKGLMTHKEAIEKGIGGSLIAYCY